NVAETVDSGEPVSPAIRAHSAQILRGSVFQGSYFMKSNMRRMLILTLVLTSVMGSVRMLRAQSQNAVGGGANGASSQINATILGVPTSVSMPSAAPVTLPPNGGSFSNQVNSTNTQVPGGALPGSSTGTVIDTTS